MDLSLTKQAVYQVSAVSHRGTAATVSAGKKGGHRLVIGDDSGQLTCLDQRGAGAQKLWSLAIPTGPIAAVVPVAELGEAASKVFVASGTHVYGVNRKGKQFFEFHTSLTDAIESMHVEGERLWVTANTVYNVFDAGEDAHFYMAPSPIVGLTVGPAVTDSPHAGVIACVDGVVRVIVGSSCVAEYNSERPLTLLSQVSTPTQRHSWVPSSGMCVLWGARDGSVGALHILEGQISPLWTWQPAAHRQGGSVTALVAGLLGEGTPSPIVAVGRSDGAVLVLGAAETGMDLVFSGDLEESVRGLALGAVSSSAHAELAAVVFSGKVVSFTTERMSAPDKADQYGRSRATVHAESRVRMLSQEVDELKKRLAKGEEALEKLRVLSKSPKSSPVKPARASAQGAAPAALASAEPNASHGISKGIAAAFPSSESKPHEEAQVMVGLPEVPVEVSASLVAEAAAYAIAVELPLPIDTVLLTTSSPIDVLDAASVSPHVLAESMDPLAGLSPGARSALSMDSATVQSAMAPDATGRMHAVFRCQDETKRWSCAVRVVEGRSTAVQLLITACSVPKVVRVATLSIKPLGLHVRMPSPAPLPASAHALAATGDFSASQAMEWIAGTLPDMPARVPEVHTPSVALLPEQGLSSQQSERLLRLGDAGPSRRIYYKSSILGSLLVLSWRDGCIVAQGQSASALAILKESLLRSATDAAVRADVQWVHSREASEALLQSLQPMIQQAAATAERAELVDVLREVTWEDGAGDAAPEWLLPELADVLRNASGYQLAAKRQPQLLKILRGVILDLFVDDAKLQGRDARGALPELQAALEASQMPRIIDMFRQHLQTPGPGE